MARPTGYCRIVFAMVPLSMTRYSRPCCCAASAADSPAGPAPMMSRSSISLKGNFAARDQHRLSTNFNFLDAPGLAFHVQIDAAGPVNEVALFDDKFIPAVFGLEAQRTVMNEITAEGSTRAAGGRIFRNVVSRSEEARMCARCADLECLARKRV